MSKIVYMDEIGKIIKRICDKYERGEIKNIMVAIINAHENSFEIGWSNGFGYLERLGILEAAKGDCYYVAFSNREVGW